MVLENSNGKTLNPASPLKISVLDQSPVAQGSSGSQALHNSIDLARLADELGYYRYWVAEHHGTPGLACASPEVLIGPIAATTSRIRVGSGGVMLPHYSALKVAENFSMLSGLFLGRIDLGLGRAAGTDPRTALALQRNRGQQPADDFKEQMMELLGRLSDTLPAGRFVKPGMLPGRPEVPEPWLLGSSPQSAVWAGELGLPYMFADFINPGGAAYIGLYHEHFVPSVWIDRPRVGAAVWAISAESANEAEELASSSRMLFALLHQGQLIDVPSVDVALQYARENAAGIQNLTSSRRAILGTSADVRAGIEAVARDYRAEEVMVVSIVHSHRARRKSYELIADAFQLRGSLAVSR